MARAVVIAAIGLAALQTRDPAAEYKERLAKAGKVIADRHVAVGDFLAERKMHGWARDEFNKAVALDSNNEEARKRLGDMRSPDGGGWILYPDPNVRTANEPLNEGEVAKIRADYDRK